MPEKTASHLTRKIQEQLICMGWCQRPDRRTGISPYYDLEKKWPGLDTQHTMTAL